MIESVKKKYLEAILETDRDLANEAIDAALKDGVSPEAAIFEIVVPIMEELAEIVKFGPDATLAQHYMASQITSQITDRLVPLFKQNPESEGHVILGTAVGDFHGLGKKIVAGCLKAKLIDVTDLGLNVQPGKFVEAALEQGAQVIAVSSMMVHTARSENGPLKVREIISKEGLEKRLRLVVGGAPYRFHPALYKTVGADAWAENGTAAAILITALIREVKHHECD